MTTDPGLGPGGLERPTLRSMAVAEPVAPDDENPGAPVYYEPQPLHAVSDHKTLELATVKISQDVDPRKLPTLVKLRRPVLHVLPASDPNWPAPSPSPVPAQPYDAGWPAQFDSGWPPPETVLTTSQPPQAARRRSFIPLVLLVLLGASLLVVLGAKARRRPALASVTAQHPIAATLAVAPLPKPVEALPSAGASAAAPPAESAASAIGSAATEASASAAPARLADAPHHANSKSISPSIANSSALSAPPTAKPKRAIY